MPSGIYKRTEEHKEKIGAFRRGKTYEEIYGEKVAREAKAKLSKASSGDGNPAKLPGVGLKISKAKKGHIVTRKTREKIRETLTGRNLSEEHKENIRQTAPRQEKHWNWQDGISFEPYGAEFSGELKLFIRQRDDNICQFCGRHIEANSHDIHHINYDKKDNVSRNLILLCKRHNALANHDREKWQFLFETLQEIRGVKVFELPTEYSNV